MRTITTIFSSKFNQSSLDIMFYVLLLSTNWWNHCRNPLSITSTRIDKRNWERSRSNWGKYWRCYLQITWSAIVLMTNNIFLLYLTPGMMICRVKIRSVDLKVFFLRQALEMSRNLIRQRNQPFLLSKFNENPFDFDLPSTVNSRTTGYVRLIHPPLAIWLICWNICA